MTPTDELACVSNLEAAYEWLCHRRKDYPDHADVWSLRFNWPDERARIQHDLLTESYRFEPLSVVTNQAGETLHIWSARDALVLKALTITLHCHLPVSKRCVHVKGRGGAKAAVRAVRKRLPSHQFVLKTDIQSYYASVDHHLLLEQLAAYVKERFILNLLWQYMHRVSERGGLFKEHRRGIPRGCALSPLIGALFLGCLDRQMENLGLFYVRFMDDFIILTPTRWKLRAAVKVVNQTLNELKLSKHPAKTFIGRIEKGFDFLGYHFSRERLRLAGQTVRNFTARLHRLYEQQKTAPDGAVALGEYVTRWLRWTRAGLGELDRGGTVGPTPSCESQTGEAKSQQA